MILFTKKVKGIKNMERENLIGKHVLIGITYLDHNGNITEQNQVHGDIIEATDEMITVKLTGSGEEFTLPPAIEAFQPAPEGVYRLRSSGEEVTNPDLLTTWQVTTPPPNTENASE